MEDDLTVPVPIFLFVLLINVCLVGLLMYRNHVLNQNSIYETVMTRLKNVQMNNETVEHQPKDKAFYQWLLRNKILLNDDLSLDDLVKWKNKQLVSDIKYEWLTYCVMSFASASVLDQNILFPLTGSLVWFFFSTLRSMDTYLLV